MKIGLLDADGHNFPNLALMKISSYHKKKGDSVFWVENFGNYDIVYKVKVFTFSLDQDIFFNAKKTIKGGTGYNLQSKLPKKIENCFPDYDIYHQFNFAVGYLTRGCPRQCPFCIVSKKEGSKSYKVANLKDFWNKQKKIKLLDPNLLACPDKDELLQQLIKSNCKIDFTQGLDIRFCDKKTIKLLSKINIKNIHFAFDRMNQKNLIEKNLKLFKEFTGLKRDKVTVFVLVNYETTIEQDFYRINFIRSLNFQPYVMIYDKHKLKKGKSIYFKLQRWVNNPRFFWKFENFFEYVKNNYIKKENL